MLQNIRKNSQGTVAKMIVGLIVVVFALFGVESIVGGIGGDPEVATVNGDDITFDLSSGVMITDARMRTSNVVEVDIQGTNGVIHAISKVILPTP